MLKKSDYVAAFADKAGITKAEATRLVDILAELHVEAAKAGESVLLPGVGKLVIKEKAAGTARNPRTGETTEVAARMVPKVTVSKTLKDAVAG